MSIADSGPHKIAILVYEGLHLFEYGCALEIFDREEERFGRRWYDVTPFSVSPGNIETRGGLTLTTRHGLEALEEADTVLVPGWPTGRDPGPDLIEKLIAASRRGCRLTSICSGAFVLAATGLLDGRRATTHWVHADAFAKRFPLVILDPSVLYVDEGEIVTSAGSAAGIDMMLHLVRRDFGAAVCNDKARRLVLPPHRDGGQAQFVKRPVPDVRGTRINGVVEWLQANPDAAVTVSDLARRAGMSDRSFYRKFRDAVGVAPHEFLIRQRIDVARGLLESRDAKIALDVVMEQSGFGSPEAFRQHFRRIVGRSPADYRRAFATRRA